MIIPAEAHDKPEYRFRRGSKLADFPPLPPQDAVPPLSSFDGPFQLAEYLSLKVRHDPHDIKGLVDVPSDNAKAADKHVWIYEHLRRIPIDATPLITQLLQMCSRKSCPEMKADEWQYLCVAHGGEGTDKCCAIDYILHAVDSTTALLNSSNYFPSRLQIPHASLAHFPSLFRRLSRIFSHAYFHHREAFATAESETSLYARFVALCEKYELVSSNLLIIPQSGYEATVVHDEDDDEDERSKSWDDDDHDEEEEEEDKSEKPEASEGKEGKDEGKEAESEERETAARAEDDSREHADGAMSPREDVLRATHSLGRYQSPVKWATSPVQPATKGKPAPAHTSESLSPPSTRATLEGYDAESAPAPLPKGKRGTLGRGKAPRGANVWAAEDEGKDGEEVPPLPSTIGMARKESVESVVYVGKDDEDEDDEAALPSLSDDESPSKPKPKPSEQPTAKPSTLSEAAKPSSPPKPSEPLPMPTSPSPSSSTRAPDTTSTESASPKSPSSPPRTSLSPKSILAAFPERLDSVSPKTVPPEPESTSLSTSPPAQTESAAPSLTQSTLGTSPTPQSTLSTSPNPTLSTSPNQSTLGTSPQSALGTSPRSELQARPGDNGRDQLAVSPRGGTGGRRGGSRKSRVPRSPGKKGRSEGQRTPSAVAGEGAQ